jgi:hypothetical protein
MTVSTSWGSRRAMERSKLVKHDPQTRFGNSDHMYGIGKSRRAKTGLILMVAKDSAGNAT